MLRNRRYGGHSGGETPGPIPNPEAKPTSADGTAPGRVWESRTPPDTTPLRAATRRPSTHLRAQLFVPISVVVRDDISSKTTTLFFGYRLTVIFGRGPHL